MRRRPVAAVTAADAGRDGRALALLTGFVAAAAAADAPTAWQGRDAENRPQRQSHQMLCVEASQGGKCVGGRSQQRWQQKMLSAGQGGWSGREARRWPVAAAAVAAADAFPAGRGGRGAEDQTWPQSQQQTL
eukprot:363791-Chlamydomonas_euryale.AAC.12